VLRRAHRTFTQEDPIGLAGGLNLYGFANGDPVNFSDPFGLCPTGCVLEGAGVVAAGLVLLAATTALVAGEDLGSAIDAGLESGREFIQGARDAVGNVFAAVSNKRHERHLSGLAGNVERHLTWLGGGDPGKDPNKWGDKWKRDIQKAIRNMRERIDRLKGDRSKEKWIERVQELERRLQEHQ
jgi:uncharacterized protein RhaS with RHS repeats